MQETKDTPDERGVWMLQAFGRLGKPMYGGSKRGTVNVKRVKMQKASRRANRGSK